MNALLLLITLWHARAIDSDKANACLNFVKLAVDERGAEIDHQVMTYSLPQQKTANKFVAEAFFQCYSQIEEPEVSALLEAPAVLTDQQRQLATVDISRR